MAYLDTSVYTDSNQFTKQEVYRNSTKCIHILYFLMIQLIMYYFNGFFFKWQIMTALLQNKSPFTIVMEYNSVANWKALNPHPFFYIFFLSRFPYLLSLVLEQQDSKIDIIEEAAFV